MTVYGSVFAKLPTGETVIVLSVIEKSRIVTVGTRRPCKVKTMRMFVDSLVFQRGSIRGDGSGRKIKADPYWYDPWTCEGDNWVSFDKYYGVTC